MIAGHRIVGTLERTSSGAAFRAEDRDRTPVVLRLIKPPGGRAAVTRFHARAEQLSALSHGSIARVTGFGEAPEGLWLATVEVNGVTLRSLMDKGLAPMRAVRLLGEVADGLDAAHSAGVAHGDVRAENVIVQGRPSERALLVGFPLDPEAPDREQDVSQLAGILRECLPDADLPAAGDHTTAGELVANAAHALLRATPAQTDEEGAAPGDDEAVAPRKRRRRGRRLLKVLAGILVVAGAAGAGYAVSEMSDDSEAPAEPGEASAGALSVAVPSGWEQAPASKGLAQLRDEVLLRRGSPAGAISAGIAVDRSVVLDPSLLAAEFGGRAPRPELVRLGKLSAMRFEGLRGGGPSVVYVASTSEGAPAVVCAGSPVSEACAQAAGGLSLRGARPYDPAAGIAWKNALARDMRRLRAQRAGGLRALREAATPAAQEDAANLIARAHASAARSLRRRKAPPQAAGPRRRVLQRLLAADRAYRALARAAGADDEEAFERAQRRVRGADRSLQVTLRSL